MVSGDSSTGDHILDCRLQEFRKTLSMSKAFDRHEPNMPYGARCAGHHPPAWLGFRANTVVMSQNEIHPKVKLKTVGQV